MTPKTPPVRELLRRFGYKPKKRLGQHFLVDTAAAARIAGLAIRCHPGEPEARSAEALSLSKGVEGHRIVEIGPGTGTLTRALLDSGADVTAVEIDPEMVRILHDRGDLEAAVIVTADALAFDYQTFSAAGSWCVAGNLPYNVATPLIMQFIEMRGGPDALVVMVQKDVAGRFAAHPGTPSYGSLSVAVQYAMTVERALTLRPGAFYPRPKVDSTVVVLRRRERPAVHVRDEPAFLKVVRAAFAYRRKTLANSLSLALGLERAHIAATLIRLGYPTEIRGEQLAITDFARIADDLSA